MSDNKDMLAHLRMIFLGKLHQFFQHLASFSQNSINTNKVEIGNSTLEMKHITISMKLAAKFIIEMVKHIDDNSVPKEISAFAKDLFVEQTVKCIALAIPDVKQKKQPSTQPAASGDDEKRKANVNEPGQNKPRKKFSDKSAKILGDPYSKKSPLPSIGKFQSICHPKYPILPSTWLTTTSAATHYTQQPP
jgi:hypothetical protein